MSRARDTASGNAWKTYRYDNRGNVTNNSKLGFTYDWANQPTAITGGAGNGSYVYDGSLKRAKQTVGGKTIYSVYGASGSLIHRDDATANEKTDYIRAAGKTIARIKGSTVSYMHQDHLGSSVASTTAVGAIAPMSLMAIITIDRDCIACAIGYGCDTPLMIGKEAAL